MKATYKKNKAAVVADSMKPVAIQGYEGSFHEEAALQYFGRTHKIFPCNSFGELIKATSDKALTSCGVMAIENSIAGSILANYNLLHQSSLTVTGEIYMEIRQQLLANKEVTLKNIREVHSHTMALQQCLGFLNRHTWKLVETEDTALSAKKIAIQKSRTVAVVASRLAARRYGLQVLAPNIQTQKNNYTRFLVLHRKSDANSVPDADKASLMFSTDHSRGSLVKVLSLIADQGINLSKLQSFPIPGSEFRYAFHADLEFDNQDDFRRACEKMKSVTQSLRVYGMYKKGLWK